ncbi:MAG TPA: hypothetical protein VGY48_14505 [Vicinamibacterales bacterium]|jgi:hypothetical protein|nr:hypothetical protein [Vicinamibacterales bacterium]
MLDPLLRRFVEATNDADAERELNALIEEHALPLAKAIVGRKLRTVSGDRPGGLEASDREDAIGDSMLMLVDRLQAARNDRRQASIESFVDYSAAVIHSACAHHIRRRHPERARLKNRLRYVFSTDSRLALWKTSDDELACGLAEWRGDMPDAEAARALPLLVERAGRRWTTFTRLELAAAAVELAAAVGKPVDFDAVVAAASSGIVEPRGQGDLSTLASPAPAYDAAIDRGRFLELVWHEVSRLPLRQRLALLLNLRDSGGGGLLWLLPIAGVATVRQIAGVLEIPDGEFARLWREIPLDDTAISARLGCTRQQVINLRMAARKRLVNRVGEPSRDPAGRGSPPGPRGNLRAVSASLKGNA